MCLGEHTVALCDDDGVGLGFEGFHVHRPAQRDAEALQAALKDEVIPLYYQRDRDGLPRAWIKRMKRAIRTMG